MDTKDTQTAESLQCYYQISLNNLKGDPIFINEQDYQIFLSIIEKLLVHEISSDQDSLNRRLKTKHKELELNDSVEVIAYCLEPSHFCLLLYQNQENGINKLIHNLTINYNQYFFDNYKIEDVLDETKYIITNISPAELLNSSCEMHTNTKNWLECYHSSIRAYLYDDGQDWVNKLHIIDKCNSVSGYLEAMKNFKK